jgi:putative MATE family efflux protein
MAGTETIGEAEPGAALAALPRGSLLRQVTWLAVPVMVEQVLVYLVGFSDTLLTGRYLDVDSLAAVTVSSYLLWFAQSLIVVASAGGTALVARLVGAGDRAGASHVAQQAMGLGLVVGVSLAAVGLAVAPMLIVAMGLRGEAAAGAVLYLRIILVALPLMTCELVGNACLRGAGDTRTGMVIMSVVNVLNITLSWGLVQGWGPLPRLGLAGVALGTAMAEAVGGLMMVSVLLAGRQGLALRGHRMVPHFPSVRRLLRISLPATGEMTTNSLCQLWFLGVINRLGPTATAAHGVAIRCEAIAFLTISAFSVAASTLTGQYLGARRPDLAVRAARTAWGLGVLVLSLIGLVLAVGAEPLFGVFLGRGGTEVARLGAPLLRIVAFALPCLATISVLGGALRGAGDTRWPWVIVLVGYLLVRMPLTYWLTSPDGGGLGLSGAWIAMFADLAVRATLTAGRFAQGGWREVRV